MRDHPDTIGSNGQTSRPRSTLHLPSAFCWRTWNLRQVPVSPAQEALRSIYAQRSADSHESPGLARLQWQIQVRAFVKNGEVSIPLSYVTGTLVKLGQGIERHARGGGTMYDWLGYALLYLGFIAGAAFGGIVGTIIDDGYVLFGAAALCGATTAVTFSHTDRKTILG